MHDTGKRDKGGREQKKKPKLDPKEKRKLNHLKNKKKQLPSQKNFLTKDKH